MDGQTKISELTVEQFASLMSRVIHAKDSIGIPMFSERSVWSYEQLSDYRADQLVKDFVSDKRPA